MRVLVTDRSKVIAELNKPNANLNNPISQTHPIIQQLIDKGLFRPGIVGEFDNKEILKKSPIKSKAGTWRELLDADRGE